MIPEFDGERALEHVRYLSVNIGPRMMGTNADREAATYVRTSLEALGLPVWEQTFEVETGEVLGYKLEVLDPPLGEIPCYPVLLTPETPDEGLVGELVCAEGSEEPQVGPHLQGKVVLWTMTSGSRRSALLKHKPLAILRVSQDLGVLPKQYEMTEAAAKPFERVPTFTVTYEDALRLVQQGARQVRLFSKSRLWRSSSFNVIGEVKGTEYPDEIIVIGGHLDTTPNLPGATDDASGCAVVMELARLYAQRGSKRTLRFATWGGEEGGLLGSRHYVRWLKDRDKEQRGVEGFVKDRDKTELDKHLLSVCLDVVGMTLGWSGCFVHGPSELLATMSVLSAELGIPHEVNDSFYGSDHLPFAWAGIPSFALGRLGGATNYMHTPADSVDLIDAVHLEQVGRYADVFLSRMAATGYAWPFKREVPEKARKEIGERLKEWGEEIEEPGK